MAIREEYALTSRLPAAIGLFAMFAGGTVVFLVEAGSPLPRAAGFGLAILSVAMAAIAAISVANLVRHEGWSVVLSDDTLELPASPLRGTRRDRIPYTSIEFVGVSPDPPLAPSIVLIHVRPGPVIRWIRQHDLRGGVLLAEVARVLITRVEAIKGNPRRVKMKYE